MTVKQPAQAMGAGDPLFLAPQPTDPATGLPLIQKLFIANRGEIASRIIATCRQLMIKTVVAYVREDELSRHVHEADEAVDLGSIENHAANPFLNIDLLVQTALRTGSQAVHPGYGYLSENADFAARVRQSGLVFVGPSVSAMSTLGDKRRSKAYLAEKAPHVPLIPGFTGSSLDVQDLEAAARDVGYPVMLKASAGGGGKGMRIVREPSQLADELARVQSEAGRSFGSTDCILEKYIQKSKHVEIQIVGDAHGHVVSFWERDCSAQRRHQKVIEETPCTFLSPAVRRRMSDTAIAIAGLIGYDNAGTVEFVVDVDTAQYYFLEVNARLQVEHPISEEVTRTDLVALQLFVAAGGSLASLPQLRAGAPQIGHAIECRLCAEDPANDFLPTHGTIHLWRPTDSIQPARGSTIRYETALASGSSISIYFDSMVAKVVVWAPTRAVAIQRMARALAELACVGVKTNQHFLQQCLLHPAFQDNRYNTSLIPQHLDDLLRQPTSPAARLAETILPGLFVRSLHDTESLRGGRRRPFGSVRPGFRTQKHDPVGINADVIVSGAQAQATLCQWKSAAPRAAHESGEVYVVDVRDAPDTDDAGAAKAAANQYNQISNALRARVPRDEQPVVFRVHQLTATTTAAGLPSGRPSSPSATIEIGLGEARFLAQCVATTPRGSDRLNQPQEVLVHFPHLGTWVPFQRHTLLSYSESRRELLQAESEAEESDIKAPMPCKVLSIPKKNGDSVKVGEAVMVIESMKMEVSIKASREGVFHTTWKDGDFVGEGKILCQVE